MIHSQSNPSPSTPDHTKQTTLLWASGLLLIIGCCWLMPHGGFRNPEMMSHFWAGIAVMNLGFLVSWRLKSVSAQWFWGIAIATRLLLLLMYPGGDIWRYLWEGHIQNLGFSPYHLPPTAPELLSHRTEWWSLINHPDISAIYPPVTQWGFRFLAMITPSIWLFKSAFTLADLGICWGLSRRFGYAQTLLYAWNPLIIYSFAGEGHYDSWFLLPLVAAWLVFDQPNGSEATTNSSSDQRRSERRWGISALLLGISISVKWVSLPILGFLGWKALLGPEPLRQRIKRAMVVGICALLPLVITALPFCTVDSCPLVPVSSSFVVRGRSAEVIPYIVQFIWPSSRSHNWIYGIPLCLAVLWMIIRMTIGKTGRSPRLRQFAEAYFGLVMIISPIIHAWYLTWLIPFAVASRNLGIRLVSVSVFVYFILPQRFGLGGEWSLTWLERLILWGPFILGWGWSMWQDRRKQYLPQFASDLKAK